MRWTSCLTQSSRRVRSKPLPRRHLYFQRPTMKTINTPTSADTGARLARTEQDSETPSTSDTLPEPKSKWDFGPESSPKGRGIGCLSIVFAYYLIGLLIWMGENWKADPPVFRVYVLAPLAWPAAMAGFVSQKILAARIVTALVFIFFYGCLLRYFITAKTRRMLWLSFLLLVLLFLLSIGGCFAEFGQDMQGVC